MDAGPPPMTAVVLAGGRATRLGGRDKASLRVAGGSLLERALDAVSEATAVAVVGDVRLPPAYAARGVLLTREEPPLGGPVAGLVAGLAVLPPSPLVAVVAVDMPAVGRGTLARLVEAATGRGARATHGDGAVDGAVLTGPDGRRQLAAVVRRTALDLVLPTPAGAHGAALHRILAGLDLVEVPGRGEEATDVDRPEDLARLQERLQPPAGSANLRAVNLHDWIDELCDALDIDAEVDEGLVLDLARVAAHNVERPAAPVTTYLLGLAVGSSGAGPDEVERLAARAQALADGWDRPAGAPDPEDVDDAIPDDSAVDHTGESLDD
jgi:molybdopterin-guanine dinucleotide biosynthesis protein A